MFFKKKKPKLDAKVRFQHKQFTGKLKSASSYRRSVVAVPETRFQKQLARVGLGSKWSQAGLVLVLLAIAYIVYFPNVLTLENIQITGLSETQARDLEIEIRSQVADSNFFLAQRNLFFFSPDMVISAADKVKSVYKIAEVKKNYQTKTLQVVAESKYEKYLVATPEQVLDVYNDGTFKSEAGVKRIDWLALDTPNMLKVQFGLPINAQPGAVIFEPSLRNYIDVLSERLKVLANLKIAFYSFKEDAELPIIVEPTQEESGSEDSESTDNGQNQGENQSSTVDAQTQEQNTESVEGESQTQPEPVELKLPFNSSEVHVSFYKGSDRRRTFRVIFDTTRDSAKSVEDLSLLLSQTAPERFEQLAYIDMRIEGKAFLCLLNAPCRK